MFTLNCSRVYRTANFGERWSGDIVNVVGPGPTTSSLPSGSPSCGVGVRAAAARAFVGADVFDSHPRL
jgi:hypothetical protein